MLQGKNENLNVNVVTVRTKTPVWAVSVLDSYVLKQLYGFTETRRFPKQTNKQTKN